MLRARRGENGPLFTLKQYIEAEEGQTDSRKWKIQPICPDCGEPVHPYDIAGAVGFKLAGQEVTKRNPRARIGFHHYDNQAGENCPSSFRNDKRFIVLGKQKYDFRVHERNKKILHSPEVAELNAGVLRRLWRELAGKPLQDEDKKRLYQLAMRRKIYNIDALGSYPWLLPYFLVILDGHHQRFSQRKNKHYLVAFKGEGKQLLRYIDSEGKERSAEVPLYVQLHYIDEMKNGRRKEGRAVPHSPRFLVSEEAAYELAGIPKPKKPVAKAVANSGQKSYQLSLFPASPDFGFVPK